MHLEVAIGHPTPNLTSVTVEGGVPLEAVGTTPTSSILVPRERPGVWPVGLRQGTFRLSFGRGIPAARRAGFSENQLGGSMSQWFWLVVACGRM